MHSYVNCMCRLRLLFVYWVTIILVLVLLLAVIIICDWKRSLPLTSNLPPSMIHNFENIELETCTADSTNVVQELVKVSGLLLEH